MDDAREAWRQNPLARRLVGMVTAYVVGNGITLRSEYAPLQHFIDDFWQRNQMDQRVPEWCDELCRSGEVFPVLFTNPQDRRSTIRCVPASIVERIEWREGDYEAELRFKEASCAGGPAGGTLVGVAPAPERKRPVHAADAALCGEPAGGGPAGGVGPGADPALARRYSRWLEDRVRLNAGVRAFLWVVKAPARLRMELAERYRQPPEPGSGDHCGRAGVVDGGRAQPQRQRCGQRRAGDPVDDRRGWAGDVAAGFRRGGGLAILRPAR